MLRPSFSHITSIEGEGREGVKVKARTECVHRLFISFHAAGRQVGTKDRHIGMSTVYY